MTQEKSIYRSEKSKNKVLELYDSQTGKPLLVFHGGNATTAYNLKYCDFLLEEFRMFAVDTIGHPGESAEVSLSPRNQDYGKRVVEVIKGQGAYTRTDGSGEENDC